MMNRMQVTLLYAWSLAMGASLFIIGSNVFQSFALFENDSAKKVLKFSLIISDDNGTEISRVPINASQSGNTTNNIDSTLAITIKNLKGDTLISDYHVQTGCEMGGPLHGCVLK